MAYDPTLTQRIQVAVQQRIVKDWRSRWTDYSTQIAKWGALLQGALLLVPANATWLPKDASAYLALIMFIMVGAAKLITEPGKE